MEKKKKKKNEKRIDNSRSEMPAVAKCYDIHRRQRPKVNRESKKKFKGKKSRGKRSVSNLS
jgi:hypothetical protein